ncbi:hypothetical protein DPMN_106676 [Dreissena polymorpha]|uniref:Uncharacterized protein n=1 Tax=Dreissena polymorpha TaxID=45954 RepID=A0A9D4QJ74_DREPO|nr:hypothetical protein DPMN_106676 [Dreissena polymorpha]
MRTGDVGVLIVLMDTINGKPRMDRRADGITDRLIVIRLLEASVDENNDKKIILLILVVFMITIMIMMRLLLVLLMMMITMI